MLFALESAFSLTEVRLEVVAVDQCDILSPRGKGTIEQADGPRGFQETQSGHANVIAMQLHLINIASVTLLGQ